jgi:hypothetical protein
MKILLPIFIGILIGLTLLGIDKISSTPTIQPLIGGDG